MARCDICGEDIPGRGGLFKHRWEAHPEEAKQTRLAGIQKRSEKSKQRRDAKENGNGHKPEPSKPTVDIKAKPTTNIGEATTITISPKTFSMTSSLLWLAMEVAKREWGWPANMSPEDFLDTYLYESFKQRGIVLGGYQVMNSQDNGHYTEEEMVAASSF